MENGLSKMISLLLSIEGEEMVGTIGEDIISFDDMLEMGVKVIFAKDGTEAMDPALYLTEEENAVIGEWVCRKRRRTFRRRTADFYGRSRQHQ